MQIQLCRLSVLQLVSTIQINRSTAYNNYKLPANTCAGNQYDHAYMSIMTLYFFLYAAQHSPGVWLSLDNQLVPNNSAVELRKVYETQGNYRRAHTLLCVTPKRPCCKTPPYRFGEWFYPNGSAVSIDNSGNSFYRDREDDGTVRLHRRGVASLSAAMGQYCCEIPNANDTTHRLCVHFSKLIL